jgi:hypothetical protein
MDPAVAGARTGEGVEQLSAILCTRHGMFGLPLSRNERLRAGVALIIRGACSPDHVIDKLAPEPAERRRLRFLLAAAHPDRESKRAVLGRCLHDAALPEHWIGAGLAYLNHPAHAHITRTLLSRALAVVPRLARANKIFFVNRWLAAFIDGQHEQRALDIVHAFLRRATLESSLRSIVLEAADGLERAVRIRARWATRAEVVSKL